MPRNVSARVIGAAVLLVAVGVPLAWRYATAPDPGAKAARTMTICHRTESATAPWVFMTIDEATWPEHQAAGDIRASSLADCVQPPAQAQPALAAAAAPPAAQAQPADAAAAAPPAERSQPAAPPAAQTQAPAAPLAQAPSPQQSLVADQPPARALTGQDQQPPLGQPGAAVAAGQPADAATPAADPDVAVLPASGAPTADYTVTVLVLVALAGWGLYLRELGRRRT